MTSTRSSMPLFDPPAGEIRVEMWDAVDGRHPEGATLDTELANWVEGSLDVAAGDLDGVLDDSGMRVDEVVVALVPAAREYM